MATKVKVDGELLWQFALDLIKEKAGYVWGARGKIYNEAERDYLYKCYKTSYYNYDYYYNKQWKRWANHIVVDCSGLIQAFRIKYYDGKDATADGLYKSCSKKGTIDTLPKNMRGVLVFRSNSAGKMEHVGVYGGENNTIEAKGDTYGVVQTVPMTKTWTHWGILDWCPAVEVKTTVAAPKPTPVKYKVYNCYFLNVRDQAGTKGKVKKVIAKNTVVSVYETKNGWGRIDEKQQLWASMTYLKKC